MLLERHNLPVYIFILLLPVSAQGVDKSMRVDTLSLAERLSFHTNMVDWTLLTPNVGVEFDVRSTNWNRWAVGMDLRYNWQTKNTFKSGLVYNIMGARLYFRNYWRPRQIGDEGVSRHTRFIDRVFSCRRTRVKHPGCSSIAAHICHTTNTQSNSSVRRAIKARPSQPVLLMV